MPVWRLEIGVDKRLRTCDVNFGAIHKWGGEGVAKKRDDRTNRLGDLGQ